MRLKIPDPHSLLVLLHDTTYIKKAMNAINIG
jgi:hypothetical protein